VLIQFTRVRNFQSCFYRSKLHQNGGCNSKLSKISGSDIRQFTAFLPEPDVEKRPDIWPTGYPVFVQHLVNYFIFISTTLGANADGCDETYQ